MVNNIVTESPDYKDVLAGKFFNSRNTIRLTDEDLQWVQQASTVYYSDLLDMNILWAEDRNSALIAYHQKRNDENLSISMVSLNQRSIKWTKTIEYKNTGMSKDAISISQKEGWFYIISNGNLYKISQDEGNINYVYQYRWNKVK